MLTGGIFLAVALPLFWFYDSGIAVSPLVVAMLVGAYALAYNVEFEVGPGLAPATQLVFVPLLFLLPLELVPLCVAAGVMLGNVLELVEGRIRLERVLGRLGEACYSLGPVLVLVAAGAPAPGDAAILVLLAALAAQFAVDFAIATMHARIALGISPRLFIRDLAVAWGVGCDPRARSGCSPRSQPSIMLLPSCSCSRSSVSCDLCPRAAQPCRSRPRAQPCAIAAPRCCSATSSRQTTRTRARTAAMSSQLSIAVAERARARRTRPPRTEFVALLHDVGKIRIPNEIINKPGPLTPERACDRRDAHGRRRGDARPGRRRARQASAASSAPAMSASTAAATPTGSPARRSRLSPGSSAAATRTAR